MTGRPPSDLISRAFRLAIQSPVGARLGEAHKFTHEQFAAAAAISTTELVDYEISPDTTPSHVLILLAEVLIQYGSTGHAEERRVGEELKLATQAMMPGVIAVPSALPKMGTPEVGRPKAEEMFVSAVVALAQLFHQLDGNTASAKQAVAASLGIDDRMLGTWWSSLSTASLETRRQLAIYVEYIGRRLESESLEAIGLALRNSVAHQFAAHYVREYERWVEEVDDVRRERAHAAVLAAASAIPVPTPPDVAADLLVRVQRSYLEGDESVFEELRNREGRK